jgi:hypothetical protein
MARSSLLPIKAIGAEVDVFSNKSSLILFWLLVNSNTFSSHGFSVNEIARSTGISIGLAHKVIRQLAYIGIIQEKGLRTNKRFYLKAPDKLLLSWVKEYKLVRKTDVRGYYGFDVESIKSKLEIVPALHSASAMFFKIKTTNLTVEEYYVIN